MTELPFASQTAVVLGDVTQNVIQFGGDFLYLALVFFVLALVAAVLGAQGIAGLSMDIAKWLVIIFIVLAVVSLLL
jgi:uncharacterized membrane protein YtjA (UPF0391 family)